MSRIALPTNSREFLPHFAARSLNVSGLFRVSVGLTAVTIFVVGLATILGFTQIGDMGAADVQGEWVKSIARAAPQQPEENAEAWATFLRRTVQSSRQVQFARVEHAGRLIASAGSSERTFPSVKHRSPVRLPDGSEAMLTIGFSVLPAMHVTNWATQPLVRFLLFLISGCCLGYFIVLRRTIATVEATVPPHFRATLNSLTQGLVVLDLNRRVLLANHAFAEIVGIDSHLLEGQNMNDLPWLPNEHEEVPWDDTIRTSAVKTSSLTRLIGAEKKKKALRTNAAPLIDEHRKTHGVLVSFDDVTQLEARNAELTQMLHKLRDSRDQIHQQNQELQVLATRDPLTFAHNRRSFFEQLKCLWSSSVRYGTPFGCLMIDIDYFKQINDRYGHAAGDAVLRDVACVIMKSTRQADITCRYGGEEFCVLLPQLSLDGALEAAERIRIAIENASFNGVCVTASFGVSAIGCGADSPERLIDMADRALFEAKSSGRNRIVRGDHLAVHKSETQFKTVLEDARYDQAGEAPTISFQTVSALTNALAYRDAATAEHSCRVAELCVRLASDLMSMRECYILENAALLHDIGKIGVPDSILLKPGPLTDEEWVVMKSHDRIGQEIIRSTFSCDELAEIVECHQLFYGGGDQTFHGNEIPLGARILSIADSYDAMVTDRVYRRGRPPRQAMSELRRCAGKQFDPELVERFIEMCQSNDPLSSASIVNSNVALRLGQQTENLARALNDQDVAALAELTQEILETTANSHLDNVARLAGQLHQLTQSDADWTDCLGITLDLLDCCHQTQRAHLHRHEETETDRSQPVA